MRAVFFCAFDDGIIGLLVFMRGVPEMGRFFSAINYLSVQSVDKLHR